MYTYVYLQEIVGPETCRDLFLCFCLQTDSSIIGGMVVEVGDKYIDMSTATKVKKIMQSLRDTV